MPPVLTVLPRTFPGIILSHPLYDTLVLCIQWNSSYTKHEA